MCKIAHMHKKKIIWIETIANATTPTMAGKMIYPMEDLPRIIKSKRIMIAIVAVPVKAAQQVVDLLARSGAKAIWNFAPTLIDVPNGVVVETVDLASSLAVLNHRLNHLLQEKHTKI